MKVAIDVRNKRDASLIANALDNPEVRALVLVLGVLAELPTEGARHRVLTCATVNSSSLAVGAGANGHTADELALLDA